MTEFKIPELGENVTSGDVTRVLVNVGDTLSREQAVLELETDKATIEVPSSVEGVIRDITVKAGDTVSVGAVVLTVDEAAPGDGDGGRGAPAEPAPAPAPEARGAEAPPVETPPAETPPAEAPPAETPPAETPPAETPPAETPPAEMPPAEAPPAETPPAETPPAETPPARSAQGDTPALKASDTQGQKPDTQGQKVVSMPPRPAPESGAARAGGERAAGERAEQPAAAASPGVRRLAREIGVDVHDVQGTGGGGRITQDDVKEHARRVLSSIGSAGAAPARAARALPDFAKWGEVERQPWTNVRRTTAQHLSHAWTAIPHVTQFDKADVTALDELRKTYKEQVASAGGALTITAILVRVLATAVRAFPQFNASIDPDRGEIVYKKYVNVGVAVDTDRGLLVPVIRHADRKNVTDIAVELHQLAEKARQRKLTPDDMSGGGITISNLGGIGGTAFTPIVNWPEVAILGVSRAATEPVWTNGSFEPRLQLPLSLSYDHRVIDGADAMRFLRWVVDAIEQPFLLVLNG